MRRVCFLLQVRKDRLAEYRERHRAVWPEMREALTAAGWRNYSLFLREDGLLVGGAVGQQVGAPLRFLEKCLEKRGEFALPDHTEIDGGEIGEAQNFNARGKFFAGDVNAEAEAA